MCFMFYVTYVINRLCFFQAKICGELHSSALNTLLSIQCVLSPSSRAFTTGSKNSGGPEVSGLWLQYSGEDGNQDEFKSSTTI